MTQHTIVLIQYAGNKSRTYFDYETVKNAMDGICQLFEAKLKQSNPNIRNIQYSVSDLFEWADGLADLSCLVFDPNTHQYKPHDREWIKKKVFEQLKKQVSQ
jgi:hypothetical protein